MTNEQTPEPEKDRAVGDLVEKREVFQLQAKEPGMSDWVDLGAALADRDRITVIQAYVLNDRPQDRQCVLRHEIHTYVEEIIGDGEGETSPAELLARNEQVTAAPIAKKNQQPSQ
jgi:hypothetical protein